MTFDFNSYVSRWIAFGGAAAAALLASFVANEAQTIFHLSLNEGSLVAFLTPFTVGTFALAWKFLHGRAEQEFLVLENSLERDFHLNPAVISEIERIVEQHLPEPPATKTGARKR